MSPRPPLSGLLLPAVRALVATALFSVGSASAVTPSGYEPGKEILPHLVGYNNQMANVPSPWGGAAATPTSVQLRRQQALVASRPGSLRYPGGSVSSYWDYEYGRLFNPSAAINPADTVAPRDFTLRQYTLAWVAATQGQPNTVADFMGAYQAVAASPSGPMGVVFVLNLVTPGADYYRVAGLPALPAMNGRPARAARPGPLVIDQTPGSADWWAMLDDRFIRNVAMLEDARARGIPIRYVELGNEYFFGQSTTSPTGAVVEPYSAGAQGDAAMIGAFPDRDTAWDADTDPDRGRAYAVAANDWAQMLLARYPGVRLCAIGSDANSSTPSRRNDWNRDVLSQVDKALVPAVAYHIYGKVPTPITTTEENLATAVAAFRHNWAEAKEDSVMPADREVWITEWNHNLNIGSWSHAMVSLYQLLHWLEQEPLGLTNFHQFGQGIIAGSVGNPTGGLSATGRALSLASLATKGSTVAWRVQTPDAPALAGQADVPAVQVWAFGQPLNRSGSYLAVNFSAAAVTLQAGTLAPTGTVRQASAALGTTSADPGETELPASAEITLPPFSLTVFAGTVPVFGDVVAPTVGIVAGVNPSGANAPGGASGFVQLTATDEWDAAPRLYIRDSGSDFVAGPYASGVTLKITTARGAKPSAEPMDGAVQWHLKLRGTAEVYAEDESGNVSEPLAVSGTP